MRPHAITRAGQARRSKVCAKSVGFFGGEGFIMQKLEGDGLAFVHAGGTVVKRELQAGQTLMVDTGCVVAYTPNVNFEIQYVGKIKTALFGGEGLFFAKMIMPPQWRWWRRFEN